VSTAAIAAAIEINPPNLSDAEVARLLDFLEALTDFSAEDAGKTVPTRVPSDLPLAEIDSEAMWQYVASKVPARFSQRQVGSNRLLANRGSNVYLVQPPSTRRLETYRRSCVWLEVSRVTGP
jgi:hypothetical protein